MDLWSRIFRKKDKDFEFDLLKSADEHKAVIEKEFLHIFTHTKDEAFLRLERIFTASFTVQLLETNAQAKEGTPGHYQYSRGRLDALRDVIIAFQTARSREVHTNLQKKYQGKSQSDEKVLGFKKKGEHKDG